MPSDPVEQLRAFITALDLHGMANRTFTFPALLTTIDRLQRIEAAAI